MIPIIGEVWSVNGKKVVMVRPQKALTADDEEHLCSALGTALGHNPELIVVDLTNCPAIAEEPKKALISVFTQAGRRGVMAFAGASSAIRASMVTTKLEALFVIHQTVVDALVAFAPPTIRDNW